MMTSRLRIYLTNFGKLLTLLAIVFILPYFIQLSEWKINEALALQSGKGLSGYAWSENVGWISFNGANYEITVDSYGQLSGYAWSDNIGWISANTADLAGCPKTPCTAKLLNNKLTGWFKALSGGSSQSGGWDGWISLSSTTPAYGPVLSNGSLSGYAWGGDVVGWLDFSAVKAAQQECVPAFSCSGSQNIVYTNSACQTSTYLTCVSPDFCSIGSSSCIHQQSAPTATPVGFTAFTAISHDSTPLEITSAPQDSSNAPLASNSAAPATFTATGHIQARPALLKSGYRTWLYWNVKDAQNCTVTGNGSSWTGLFSGAGGQQTLPITGQATYTLKCDALDGGIPPVVTEIQAINVTPVFQEK